MKYIIVYNNNEYNYMYYYYIFINNNFKNTLNNTKPIIRKHISNSLFNGLKNFF